MKDFRLSLNLSAFICDEKNLPESCLVVTETDGLQPESFCVIFFTFFGKLNE
jgi:hypothetical protein